MLGTTGWQSSFDATWDACSFQRAWDWGSASAPDSSFLLGNSRGGGSDGSGTKVLATRVGDLDCVLGSWLWTVQPWPLQALGSGLADGRSPLSLSLSFSLSASLCLPNK